VRHGGTHQHVGGIGCDKHTKANFEQPYINVLQQIDGWHDPEQAAPRQHETPFPLQVSPQRKQARHLHENAACHH
jgi:hypothetical protein